VVARLIRIVEIQSVMVGAGEHGSDQIFESSSLLSKAGFIAQNMDVTVP